MIECFINIGIILCLFCIDYFLYIKKNFCFSCLHKDILTYHLFVLHLIGYAVKSAYDKNIEYETKDNTCKVENNSKNIDESSQSTTQASALSQSTTQASALSQSTTQALTVFANTTQGSSYLQIQQKHPPFKNTSIDCITNTTQGSTYLQIQHKHRLY